jgi:uncharacterized protein involved in response to NO
MIECVIAGRVIPAFTMSALPGRQLKVPAWLERSTLAATALSLAAWVLLPANPATAASGSPWQRCCMPRAWWHWQPLAHPRAPHPVGAARGVRLAARRLLLLAWAQVGGAVPPRPAFTPWPWAPRPGSSSAWSPARPEATPGAR